MRYLLTVYLLYVLAASGASSDAGGVLSGLTVASYPGVGPEHDSVRRHRCERQFLRRGHHQLDQF